MSMIDDADDKTKNSIKKAREHTENQGDNSGDTNAEAAGTKDEEPRDTSGDVPVENLE